MSGTPWWGLIISGAAGGLLALTGALVSAMLQRAREERSQWFDRAKWAEQLSADPNPERAAKGQQMLHELLKTGRTPKDRDAAIIGVLASTDRLTELEAEDPDSVDEWVFELDNGSEDPQQHGTEER